MTNHEQHQTMKVCLRSAVVDRSLTAFKAGKQNYRRMIVVESEGEKNTNRFVENLSFIFARIRLRD